MAWRTGRAERASWDDEGGYMRLNPDECEELWDLLNERDDEEAPFGLLGRRIPCSS